jgi:hypothetical protein
MILAGNYIEAKTWAYGQQLDDSEWVYPIDISDIRKYTNFHVLVIGTAGHNVPNSYFERVFNLAKHQGRIDR